MKKTSHAGHTGQAAISALLEISLAVVPALLFFYTYVHHYPSATFFLRGNVLFFVVYFAILVHDDLRQLQRTEIPHAGAGVCVRPFELFHGHHCLFPHVHDRKNAPAAEIRHPHAAAAVPRGDRDFYSRPHSGRPARAAGVSAADRAGEGCRGERPQ